MPPTPDAFALPADPLYTCTRGFCLWLQAFFRSLPPESNLRWDPDDDLTRIHIFEDEPVEAVRNSTLPRISVARSPVASMGVGIDTLLTPPGYAQTRPAQHSDVIRFSVTLTFAASNGAEAQGLAMFIVRHLPRQRRLVQRVAGLHHMEGRVDLGTVTRYNSVIPGAHSDEWRQVSLSVGVSIQVKDDWVEEPSFNAIRAVEFALREIAGQEITP